MTGDDPMLSTTPLERPLTAFERLHQRRVVFLRGPLDDATADEMVAELIELDSASDADVSLLIASPEGSFRGTLAVHDVMRAMGARVHTRCVGTAGPAPAVLLASGTGTRSASPNARVMLGPPRGAIDGAARDLETQAEEATRLRRRVAGLLAERTGQPLERVDADIDRDRWLSADEAREYGLIDEVA